MKPTVHSPPRRSGPSRRFVLVGAVSGMIPAAALGIFRAVNAAGPFSGEAILGSVVFTFIYVSPYLVAVYASLRAPAVAQAPLLLAAALASILESFSAMSGVSLVLLPATLLLGIAATLAFRATRSSLVWKAAFALGATGAAALTAASFLSLYLHDDPRCWQLTQYNDGRKEWLALSPPSSATGAAIGPAPANATRQEARCTSDIITWQEAMAGVGLLAFGLFTLLGLSQYLSRDGDDGVT